MPKRISRRKARARANEGGGGRHNEEPKGESYGNAGAVESVESQKQASPSFHEPLGNLAEGRRDSHISTAPATRRMGKWKTKSKFSTFPPPRILFLEKQRTGRPGGASPSPGGGAPRR